MRTTRPPRGRRGRPATAGPKSPEGTDQVGSGPNDSQSVGIRGLRAAFSGIAGALAAIEGVDGSAAALSPKGGRLAQRRADKEKVKPAEQPILKRVGETVNRWVLQFGASVLSLWRALRRRLITFHPPEDQLSPKEYEEAETFRDRSKDELKLIYEKQELDQQRLERTQMRTGVAVAVAFVFLVLAMVAVWGWRSAWYAKKDAERAEKHAEKHKDKAVNAALVAQEQKNKAQMAAAKAYLLKRIAETNLLTTVAQTYLFTKPYQSALLAVEALKTSGKYDPSKGNADVEKRLKIAETKAEKFLRKTLANFHGKLFNADLGSLLHLAAHENENGLGWLAAAGMQGSIALWNFAESDKPKPQYLNFGYAPPIKQMLITNNGHYLVVLNYRNNLTIWNLKTLDRECRVLDSPQFANRYVEMYVSEKKSWLEIDDNVSKGKFIFLGDDRGGKEFPFDLTDLVGPKNSEAFKFHSFSKDERWFAHYRDGRSVSSGSGFGGQKSQQTLPATEVVSQ